jgi:hypothetical protein
MRRRWIPSRRIHSRGLHNVALKCCPVPAQALGGQEMSRPTPTVRCDDARSVTPSLGSAAEKRSGSKGSTSGFT